MEITFAGLEESFDRIIYRRTRFNTQFYHLGEINIIMKNYIYTAPACNFNLHIGKTNLDNIFIRIWVHPFIFRPHYNKIISHSNLKTWEW